jgi:hypothetical protein
MAVGLVLSVAGMPALQAQQADVTFFVIGKHASYQQDVGGELQAVDYSFFAEIFLADGGDASNGRLTLPTGAEFAFADQRQAEGGKRDDVLRVSGRRRYASFAELQADHPDGEYRVSFDTPSGSVHDAKLRFTGGPLPQPPAIRLSQAGARVCSIVDPTRDLQVRWSPFAEGGPDPNGLLDDPIFVILTRDDGMRVAHSGRPFENRPFLTYAAKEFTIPAGSLERDRDYSLSVEHAILDDTRRYRGVPAMTTRAVTTRVAISTAAPGSTPLPDCPRGPAVP